MWTSWYVVIMRNERYSEGWPDPVSICGPYAEYDGAAAAEVERYNGSDAADFPDDAKCPDSWAVALSLNDAARVAPDMVRAAA